MSGKIIKIQVSPIGGGRNAVLTSINSGSTYQMYNSGFTGSTLYITGSTIDTFTGHTFYVKITGTTTSGGTCGDLIVPINVYVPPCPVPTGITVNWVSQSCTGYELISLSEAHPNQVFNYIPCGSSTVTGITVTRNNPQLICADAEYGVTYTGNSYLGIINELTCCEYSFVTIYDYSQTNACTISQGSISVNVSGGTAPYIYEWTLDGVFFSNDMNIDNLDPGSYQLTVTDQCGLTKKMTFTINDCCDNDYPIITLDNVINACGTGYNGSISVIVDTNNGLDYSSFVWTTEDGNCYDLNQFSQQNPSGLTKGTYVLTVTDICGNSSEPFSVYVGDGGC